MNDFDPTDPAAFGIVCMRYHLDRMSRELGVALPPRDALEDLFREHVSAGDWSRAAYIVDKPFVLDVIEGWHRAGLLETSTLNRLLAEQWSRPEFPSLRGTRHLVRLFKAAGFVTDRPGTVPPSDVLTIYRGAAPGRARGLSWTTSLTKAQWFAKVESRGVCKFGADGDGHRVVPFG